MNIDFVNKVIQQYYPATFRSKEFQENNVANTILSMVKNLESDFKGYAEDSSEIVRYVMDSSFSGYIILADFL